MNLMAVADVLDMGGDALYVWGAYGVVGASALWEAWTLWLRRRRAFDDIAVQLLLQEPGPQED